MFSLKHVANFAVSEPNWTAKSSGHLGDTAQQPYGDIFRFSSVFFWHLSTWPPWTSIVLAFDGPL